jgi:cytochrome c556
LVPSQGDRNVKKLTYVAAALAVLAVVAVAADPSIKDIMTKGHSGGDSLLGVIQKQMKSDKPDWDLVNKNTDQLIEFGKVLPKSEYPKTAPNGSKEGWEKACKAYIEQVTALDEAAGKKDKEATAAAATKMQTNCGACHKDFKPKK